MYAKCVSETVVVGGYNASTTGVLGLGKMTSVCRTLITSLLSLCEEVSEIIKTYLAVGNTVVGGSSVWWFPRVLYYMTL